MRRVLLAVALGVTSGPALVQAWHAFAHERGVAHAHPHQQRHEDADHHDDEEHSELASTAAPTSLNAAPRLEAPSVRPAAAVNAAPAARSRARAELGAIGPPDQPPGRLVSSVPSNRAPPA